MTAANCPTPRTRRRYNNGLRKRVRPEVKAYARRLRHTPTDAERIAWAYLRKGRKRGHARWKRQAIIRGFIADFYCPAARMVLELDGPYHYRRAQRAKDATRDAIFAGLGITTVRLPNDDIFGSTRGAALATVIRDANRAAKVRGIKGVRFPKPESYTVAKDSSNV